MRIFGIIATRNEEDIIEAFARHTLKHCCGLLVMNHGSTDSTLEILQSLQNEGLPITVLTDTTLGDLQTVHMNRLLRMAVCEFAADWIVCLDSDEIIQGPLEESLRGCLGSHDDHCYRLRIVNYRAQPTDQGGSNNPIERITHCEEGELRPKCIWASKIVIPRALAMQEGVFIGKGNHEIFLSGYPAPHQWIDEAYLAHYPLRSPSQFGSKLISKVYARFLHHGPKSGTSDHYEKPFRAMRNSLSAFVENFYQCRASWVSTAPPDVPLIQAPAEYRGGSLRYTSKQHDVDQLFRNLVDLAEALAVSAPAEKVIEGEYSVTLALCDPEGVKRINPTAFPVSSTTFSDLRLTWEEKRPFEQIDIAIATERGVLEISELTVQFDHGGSETYLPGTFNPWLSVNDKALKIYDPAFVRLVCTARPFVMAIGGKELFSRGVPTAITLRARLFTDNKRMAFALFNPAAIRQVHAIPSELMPKVRYRIGRKLFFDDSGDGMHYLREGWSKPQDWGTWSKEATSSLSLRLAQPTEHPLSLIFVIRRRKGIPTRVSLKIDHEIVDSWVLEDDRYETITVTIPKSRWGRYALHLSFHSEPLEATLSETGFAIGVKSLLLEELPPRLKLLKACRRLSLPATDFILGTVAKNRFALDEEHAVHRHGRGVAFLGEGWEPPSASGCFMERNRASLSMQFSRAQRGVLLLRLFVRSCRPLVTTMASLQLEVEGRKVGDWNLTSQDGEWLEAVIPASQSRASLVHLDLRREGGAVELLKISFTSKTGGKR